MKGDPMGFGMRLLVLVVAVSLLLAACGDDTAGGGVDDGGLAAETGATGATEGDTPGGGVFPPSTGSTAPTGSIGATGPTGAEGDVQVSLSNYVFDPDPVEVASGDVIAVRNINTRTPHTFTVVGQDVDLELGPLETETVEIALDPGTYELICRFHQAQDMTATLVVT
jgi:plastocyanin